MVVAFTGKDLHARSLRNNNQTNADEKKNILAIFSKERIQNLNIRTVFLNTHKTQVCHKYIFNGTLLNRQ